MGPTTIGQPLPAPSANLNPFTNRLLRKIDLARWIYVVNPGGYIGESTRREIEYARRVGKGVLALVDVGIDGWSPEARAEAGAEMAVQRADLAAQRVAWENAPPPAEV